MKRILITEMPWQTRIAITRDHLLQNIYFDHHGQEQLERAFFKGTVTKVLPGIQTAFVNIGRERAGFLHISEIDREMAIQRMTSGDEIEEDDRLSRQDIKTEADVDKILREGEDILVQVSKEPIQEKGAKLTTCFTLPGRFVVLMPNIPRIGVSKKIEDRQERQRLREIIKNHIPEGMGVIVRTPSEGHKEDEIARDLSYLVNRWKEIQKRYKDATAPEKIHEDIDLALQTVRDYLDDEVESIICDTPEMQARIYRFVKQITPEHAQKVYKYTEQTPLFERYNIEKQIEQALQPTVQLKSGGTIIVESVEAMTVIDVNTGSYTGSKRLEETILHTNLEAAEEIVRQLRLRNIGGLIVIDFIDMQSAENKQKLYKTFEKLLRERDKFQSVVLKVSEFGLVQMTRKRSGKPLLRQLMRPCDACSGRGHIKATHTIGYHILRDVYSHIQQAGERAFTLRVTQEIFDYLINREYTALLELERQFGCDLTLAVQEGSRESYTLTPQT